jgi:hypothetical protein
MPSLIATRPFVEGVTLILWAWAAWWIPLLILFGIWEHGICRVPLTYSPMPWGIVFPLGMFTVASLRLSLAADFPPLRAFSLVMAMTRLRALGRLLSRPRPISTSEFLRIYAIALTSSPIAHSIYARNKAIASISKNCTVL